MTDRLDRIEALLLTNAEQIHAITTVIEQNNAALAQTNATLDQVATQQRKNTADIDNLLAVVSTSEMEMRSLRESVAANEKRFNILIQEMRSDRRASQQSFQALLLSLANINGRVDDLEQAS